MSRQPPQPPEGRPGLTGAALLGARSMLAEAQAAAVVPALRARGVEALMLKGLSIERWLYDPGESRGVGDIDLLVSPAQLPAAERALKDLGFVNRYDGASPEWAEEHADSWSSDRCALPVDLHRHLWGVGVTPRAAWDLLWADHDVLHAAGTPVPVPSAPARLVLAALHAAHHAGVAERKPIEDLRRAAARVEEPTWREAAALAERLDALGGFAAGLTLHPDTDVLRHRLGVAAEPQMRHTVPRMWSASPTTEGFLRIAAARGLGAKADLLRHELFPSALFMRTRSAEARMARRGGRGLAVAYVLRAGRLLVHGARGAGEAYRMRRDPAAADDR